MAGAFGVENEYPKIGRNRLDPGPGSPSRRSASVPLRPRLGGVVLMTSSGATAIGSSVDDPEWAASGRVLPRYLLRKGAGSSRS